MKKDRKVSAASAIARRKKCSPVRVSQDSQVRCTRIVENAQEGIWELDAHQRTTFVNRRMADMLGLSIKSMMGRTVPEFIFEEDLPGHQEQMKQLMRGENSKYELRLRRADGGTIWCIVSATALKDEKGRFSGSSGMFVDITERVLAEEKNRRTLELDAVFHALPDLYFRIHQTGVILDYRAGRIEDLYLSPEQFLGHRLQEVLPFEVGQQFEHAIREAHRTRKQVVIEYSLPVPSGAKVFEARLLRLGEEQLIVVVRDVTDRKRTEEALRRSEQDFRLLAEFTTDWEYWHDNDGRFLYVSPSVERITGYRPEQFMADPALLDHIIFPEDKAANAAETAKALAENAPLEIEFRIRHRDGRAVWIGHACSVIFGPDGTSRGRRATNRDITDRKQAEERLQTQAREWQTTFDAVADAVWLLDRDCRVLRCNAAGASLFGLEPGKVLGRYCWEISHGTSAPPPDCPFVLLQKSLHRETTELKIGERWCEVRVDPILEEDGSLGGAVHVISDITDRKQAAEAIERSRAELKAIYDSAPVMMCVLDEHRRVLYANRAFAEFVGQSEDVLKLDRACGVLGCINAMDDPRGCGYGKACESCSLRLALDDTLQTGNSHWGIEYQTTLVLGGEKAEVVLLGSTALIQIAGRADLLLCLQDITRGKQADKENELLARMATHLAASAEVEDMIQTVQEGTSELFSWDAHYFAVRRSNVDGFQVLYLVDTVDGQKRVFPADNWLAGDISESLQPMLRGEPVLVNRMANASEPEYDRFGDESRPSASLMFVPVCKGSDVIGILSAQSYTPFRYTPMDLRLLERVASLVAPALNRAYAEAALRESEKRFHLAMDAADEGLFDWHIPSNHIYRNPNCYSMVGYEAGEIADTSEAWAEHLHPGHREEMARRVARILAGELEVYDAEYQFRAKDGRWLWLRTRGKVVERDSDGRAVRVTGTLVDITHRKQEDMQAEALGEIATRLAACSDVEAMVGVIEEGTSRLLTWDSHYFSVSTAEPNTFRILRFVDTIDGEKQAFVPEGPHPPGLSESAWPVLSGEPVLINRSPGEPQPVFNRFGDKSRPSASLMYVPVRSGKAVIGVLSAQSYTLFRYTESDLRLLQRVADLVAPALVRACAEESLRKSEERYRTLFKYMLEGLAYCRMEYDDHGRPLDWTYLEVNDAFTRLTGLNDVVGKKVTDVLPGIREDAPELFDIYGRIASTGRPEQFEFHFKLLDLWLSISAFSPAKGHFVVAFEDITNRKTAEETLRKSEETFSKGFLASSAPINITRLKDARLLEVNEAFEELRGYSRDEVVGQTAVELGLWLDLRERKDALRRLATDGRVRNQEYRYRTKDGRILVCSYSSEIIELAGEPCGLVTLIDLTERKRAEAALQASEEKFRTLFSTMVEGVALHELVRDADDKPVDYRIIDVNPAYEKQTGLPAEKARGALAGLLYGAEPPPYLDVYTRVVETGQPEDFETFFRPLQRHFRISVFSPGKGHFATVFEDVTLAMRAEEERTRLEDQLRQVQKLEAIGQLAAGVAHDFNNLLTVLRGETSRISAAGGDENEIQEPVAVIEQAISQAGEITRSLLTFSRVMPSEKKRYDLCEVVKESERLLRHVLPARVRLETDVLSPVPCWVMADRTQLQQLILNLAINARDAMPSGGRLILSVRGADDSREQGALPGTSELRDFVLLHVRDTGVGIPPAVCCRIFEPFFTTKPREEGTGLGLSIVHGIVSDHGGQIEVESQVNSGTTFTVRFPCAPPQPDVVIEAARLPAVRGQGELILLAGGNVFMRGAIASFLEFSGYHAMLAESGEAVVALANRYRSEVRLLILGVDLLAGRAAKGIDEIRFGNQGVPTIVLAGNAEVSRDPTDERTTLISEPFSMSELARAIRDSLERGARGEVSA